MYSESTPIVGQWVCKGCGCGVPAGVVICVMCVTLSETLGAQGDSRRPALIQTREQTHGSFSRNAEISQKFKMIIREHGGQLTYIERESMEMICSKFSRILAGKSLLKEHWEDVVGYGQLALEQCV